MLLFKEELKEYLKASSKIKKSEKSIKVKVNNRPKKEPISFTKGAIIFLGLSWIGILLSAAIATYVFFGIITLSGLVVIAENNTYIRRCIKKSNRLVDVLIFMLTIYSTLTLGVTITASLTVAGLGYSLVYVPWLRTRIK